MVYVTTRSMVPEASGNEIENVAKSPTELPNGLYSVTKKVPSYDGFVALTAPEFGRTLTVIVSPMSGNKTESIPAAPKSWWKSRETLASFNPLILWTKVSPKAVVLARLPTVRKSPQQCYL